MVRVPPADDEVGRAAMQETVHQLLADGEAVCVFPEGEITGNSAMRAFEHDFLQLLPAAGQGDAEPIPIVPVHLDLMWGSIFSRRFGDVTVRRPQQLPYPVTITFGEPLPRDVSPTQARLAVSLLATAAAAEPAPGECVFIEQFVRIARRHPRTAFIADSDGTELSNFTCLTRAYALAAVLRSRLPLAERYVAIVLPPSTSGVTAALAVMLADRIPVFLNYTAAEDSQAYAIEACGIRTVLSSPAFLEKAGLPAPPGMIDLAELAESVTGGMRRRALAAALLLPARAARRRFASHATSVDETATVLFSSGSTGTPKGVVLTHHNLNANSAAVARILKMSGDDCIVAALPFFHSFGFAITFWLPLTSCMRVVYHTNPMDGPGIGSAVADGHGTILLATPTFLQVYARKCQAEQLQTLRLVVTGAEKLRPAVAKRFSDKFGVLPVEGYGCTELSPVVAVNLPPSISDVGKICGKEGSVGQALSGVTVKVVDPEDSTRVLDDDEEGLLLVRGPNVMAGYLNDPERTAEVLADGWYNTGDMATIDSAGYITITGRLSRFSKIGGEMVPHGGVEEALHKALRSDETLAVVSAVDHPAKGERLVVFHVALASTPQEVVAAMRDAGLPNLWIPKATDFHEIDSIPLLGSGKVDLKAVAQLAKELG
jgi:acyl-[acyl-carrier-protein]-phospholipid O-acyltransferase/long-chain-fatty-acid--[acyl-carrier-protein] ligase